MEDNTLISQFEKILNLENQSLSSDVFNNIKTNIRLKNKIDIDINQQCSLIFDALTTSKAFYIIKKGLLTRIVNGYAEPKQEGLYFIQFNSDFQFQNLFRTKTYFIKFSSGIFKTETGCCIYSKDNLVELYGKIMICAFFNVYTYKTPTFQIRLKSISDFDDNQPSIGDYDMMFHPLHSEESETMPLTEIKRKRKRNYDIQSYDTISLIDDKIDFDNYNFMKIKFHSFETAIVFFDLYSKKIYKNIIIQDSKDRYRVKCSDENCIFNLSFVICDGYYVIHIFRPHSCADISPVDFQWIPTVHTKEYLIRHYNIQDNEEFNARFQTNQSKYQIKRLINIIKKQSNDPKIIASDLLEFLFQIKEDGGNVVCPVFSLNELFDTVHYFYILPLHCIQYLQSPLFFNLIGTDGTFVPIQIKGEMISFNTISCNNTYIPLCFGWAPTEASHFIKPGLDLLSEKIETRMNFLCDEGKGIINAIKNTIFGDEIPQIRFCSEHLSKKHHFIHKLNHSNTRKNYDETLRKYNLSKEEREKILSTSRFYHPMTSLGHTTNNCSEVINKIAKEQHFHSIVEFMRFLNQYSYDCLLNLQKFDVNRKFVKYLKYNECRFTHKKHPGGFLVIEKTTKIQNIVLIPVKYNDVFHCDCCRAEERGFPCKHIFYIISQQHMDVKPYVHKRFYKETVIEFCNSLEIPQVNHTAYVLNEGQKEIIFPVHYIARKEKRKE